MAIDLDEYYQLLMVIASLDPLKVNIIIILSHISPEMVTGSELTMLLGYSKKARTIYRGVLDELEAEEYIIVEKSSPKSYAISANAHHPVIAQLIELSLDSGSEYTNELLEMLRRKRS